MHRAITGTAITLVAAITAGTILMTDYSAAVAKKYKYPEARKGDVVDDYHGTKVADPYRWMEDPDSKETRAWVDAENVLTRSYIDSYPAREAIEARLKTLFNYERYSVPVRHGDRYFYTRNDGLQNQAVLYMQKVNGGDPVVVLDPNKLLADGTVALTTTSYSKDGTMLGYGLSTAGSDWQELHVRDIDAGKDYDEVLKWCKFAGIAWKNDKSGFWYNRFPGEGEPGHEEQGIHSRVCWHALGTPQSADVIVYQDEQNPELGFEPFSTDDGQYVMLFVYHGTDPRNGIYYAAQDGDGKFVHLIENDLASFQPIDNIGSTVYLRTDLDAPRGRVIAIDLNNPAREHWKEIIPQRNDVIDHVSLVNNQLVVTYMQDAHHTLLIYDLDGSPGRTIALPTIGTVDATSGRREDTEMFYTFTSFTYPTTTFRYDFATHTSAVFHAAKVDFDPSQYETKQVFYASKDGTRIPMFITAKKGIKLDGNNPTLMYGYGGFDISMTPSFSASRLVWLENGGVYALTCLRGGGEYGEEWHQQGVLDRKQNVFDDFIAGGEYLIAQKYTQKKLLVIEGGSNGGLLTAAVTVQRPDLFGAVLCRVPVIDMLRYHKFTIGKYWVSDYGNAEESAKDFAFLIKYSPLHNVKPGVKYPPMLITTADHDDRVFPAHAEKFAATLQADDGGDNPILIRIETRAGHGGGKPTSKQIEEQADLYSFVYKTIGVKPESVWANLKEKERRKG
ncbi:MAG TPA: prolyl oligopeptidase family serine peptidase [Candidatus Krumholzibacteria bacterium]|nr:prolyl oligopeptidase family serine peptidase [Candidatus Krumholzibacteria bacterium]